MQHGRDEALVVHVHVGENARHRERVGHIGLTTASSLPVMCLFGEKIRAIDVIGLLGIEIATQGGIEGLNGFHINLWPLPEMPA